LFEAIFLFQQLQGICPKHNINIRRQSPLGRAAREDLLMRRLLEAARFLLPLTILRIVSDTPPVAPPA